MTHRGRYELRRVVRAAIEDAGGEIAEEQLLSRLTFLGYHGPSVRKVLPVLDPNIVFEDGTFRLR